MSDGDAPPPEARQARRPVLPAVLATVLGLTVLVAIIVAAASGNGESDGAAAVDPTAVAAPSPTTTTVPTPTPEPSPEATATPVTPSPTPVTLVPPSGVECDFYVGPSGEPGGDGSHDSPFGDFSQAMDQAGPGTVVCVLPGRYDEPLRVTASGESGNPITVTGYEGTSVISVPVVADHILVEDLEVTGGSTPEGAGVRIDGTGVTVRGNRIHDMVGTGVECVQTFVDEPPRCVNATIIDNTIWSIDGWGVWVWGDGNRVIGNDISRVFAVSHQDADAIRFFGSNHEFRGNYIHDIYESDAADGLDPHSDCFQTYDVEANYAALENIVIADNVCSTDRHGVIITQLRGLPASNIRIENNVFESNGAAVGLLLGDGGGPNIQYSGVTVANNIITGQIDFNGIQAYNGENVDLFNNVFYGDFYPFTGPSLDQSRGSSTDNNVQAAPEDFADIDNPDVRERYRPAAGASTVDAGQDANAPTTDLDGNPRPVDGTGDGQAVTDIGPYEYAAAP